MDRNELHDLLAFVPDRPTGTADPAPAVDLRVRRIRRRRALGTAALGTAAAVAVGIGVVNLPSSHSASRLDQVATRPTGSPTAAASAPGSITSTVADIAPTPGSVSTQGSHLISLAAARGQLTALNAGMSVYVAVAPGGYDGVGYNQSGQLRFWSLPAGGHWTSTGASTYPLISGNGPVDAVVSGGPVGGGSDVFVVAGAFTGDGSGDAVAFGDGPSGWGTLAPQGNALVATGHGSTDNQTPGIVLHAEVSDGQLVTADDNLLFDTADGGAYPLVRHWTWVSPSTLSGPSTTVTAAQVSAPATAPPASSCPATAGSGTYRENYSVAFPPASDLELPTGFPTGSPTGSPTVVLTLTAPGGRSPCRVTLPASTPISLKATVPGGSIWVSAPLWLTLAQSADDAWNAAGEPTDMLSYVVPASLHVTGFSSVIGADVSSTGPAPTCQIVVRDGQVVSLEMTQTS